MFEMLDNKSKKTILGFQKNEINEHLIYEKLSSRVGKKNTHNKQILKEISKEEINHYNILKKYTLKNLKPNKLKVWKYFLISMIFGITFGIKLMERGERKAQSGYSILSGSVQEIDNIIDDEKKHEKQIIDLLDEERLKYMSSIILGINDALVELTGALAGFTLSFQDSKIITVAGLVTGIAAALSMAASEYLSKKSEMGEKNPLKAALYTGSVYILVVFLLVAPFFIGSDYYISLVLTVFVAILIILIFTYYISIAKDLSFKRRFSEMLLISLGIAFISFILGFLIKIFLNINI